jgi:leucyl/phenylalanyl-tRNA--protein transferase
VLWWTGPAHGAAGGEFRLHRSLRKTLRAFLAKRRLRDPLRQRVRRVIEACAGTPRDGPGRHLDRAEMRRLRAWHRAGTVHSVETWVDGQLVGGLYGVAHRPHVLRRVDVRPRHRRVQDRPGALVASAAPTASS